METIKGNILDIKEGIIVHQTNCLGIAGAGLALAIREKYRKWYQDYHNFCIKEKPTVGTITYFEVVPNLWIANLFGQKNIGRGATVEESYDNMLFSLNIEAAKMNLPLYFPYKIGCGLGGGNYSIIKQKLEKYCPEGIIVRLD